jgi:hypothetical protein
LLYYCILPVDDFCYFEEVMAHCSPLDEATAGMVRVENMDDAIVVAKLEHAFVENPTTSNVERCPTSLDAKDMSHPVLRPNRVLIVCVPMNQVYTHTISKMDTE